ncbi:MAG: putative metal-binding motif-containing protein [Myxococcaceae bacterium]
MRASAIIFAVIFAGCSGGTNAKADDLGAYSGGDGGCSVDLECPEGMVCEGCPGTTAKTCLPGCRSDDQCEVDQVCGHDVQCLECPCPPGWCEPDPCRDQDHDGYVPSSSGCAAGKQYGDCDDTEPLVHPGVLEVCRDGVDNDCDGLRDSSDPQCQVCATDGGLSCTDVWSCSAGGQVCDNGCCVACPPVTHPTSCPPGECLFWGPFGTDGCAGAEQCEPCASSCANGSTVCGVDFSTYTDECRAMALGVPVLHYGACWSSEGVACSGPNGANTSCGPSGQLYCRDGRCAQLGSCATAADCPAALNCTDGGTAALCVDHRCSC